MVVTIIAFVLIFGVVVIAHELGHFLLAKSNGIRVLQFSIGMGYGYYQVYEEWNKVCAETAADWRGMHV